MPRNAPETARLILVAIERGEGRLIYASSPSLPGLHVTATSEEELAREVPACIQLLLKAQHGFDVEVYPVEPDEHFPPHEYVPWAAIPATSLHREGCH